MCFLECFWALEERKNVERNWAERKFQKKCVSPGCGVLGAIYSLGHKNRGEGHCRDAGGHSRAAGL